MSHTLQSGDVTFIFNGDYSGDVTIERGSDGLIVPTADLLRFAAEYVRSKRIAALEQPTTLDELLQL